MRDCSRFFEQDSLLERSQRGIRSRTMRSWWVVGSIAMVVGCGTRDGEPGGLRALFSDDLSTLNVDNQTNDNQTNDNGESSDTTPGNGTPPGATNPQPPGPKPPVTPPSPTTTSGPSEPTSTSTNDTDATDTTEPVSTLEEQCPTTEGELRLGATCTVGVGACVDVGQVECVELALVCSAVAGTPTDESCNGEDDDCNGEVDDAIAPSGTCMAGTGACAREGQYTCQSGQLWCDAEPGAASVETCNGEDDDCDELVDEGFGFERCTEGMGACARSGDLVCEQGELVCDAVPAASQAEECNELDDDCDGEIDEDFDLGAACTVGLGNCQATGEIVCSPDGSARCTANAGQAFGELCNDEDDDCDGEVDNGNVCPDSTVANTKPFTSGVWYLSTTGTCGVAYVLQIYPTVNETTYYSSFPCDARWWYFRPGDDELLYSVSFYNTIELHNQGQAPTVLLTSPVNIRSFGADAQNRTYYLGQDWALRRDYNEILATDVDVLSAVAADGRTLIIRDSQLQILSEDGETVVPIDPQAGFSGTVQVRTSTVTVDGNDLFLVYTRQLPSGQSDIGVFRIDATNQLELVRRQLLAPGTQLGNAIALPDGTILEMTQDPDATSEQLIRRYAPDGTTSVIWRETETDFGIHGLTQLMVGPRLE